MWAELIWLKTGSLTACEYGNYPSSSIQKKPLLTIWGGGSFLRTLFHADRFITRMLSFTNTAFPMDPLQITSCYGMPVSYTGCYEAGSDRRSKNLHDGLHNSDFPLTSFINQQMQNARYTHFQDFHYLLLQ
jgi:hypothetical protein